MHAPSVPQMREMVAIQYLRGIAALMVVVYHIMCNSTLYNMKVLGRGAMFLNSGVDIFFVISGFIMWHTTRGHIVSPTRFMTDRIIRIVPLYWAATIALLCAAFFFPMFMRSAVFNLEHGVKSLFFIPMRHPMFEKEFWPFLVPGWTLNYEMFFYIVFALSLAAPSRLALPILIGVFAAFSALARLAPGSDLLIFYGDLVIFEFILGVLISEAVTRGWRLPKGVCVALIVIGFVILSLPVSFKVERLLKWGLPAMAIVGGAVFYELRARPPRIPALKAIGDFSYSLYLTHALVIAVAAKIASRVFPGKDTFLTTSIGTVVILVSALTVAYLAHRLIEKPSSRVLKQMLRLSPKPARATAPA
ncbi:MAG: acyltransferase [Caulobacterales bacterium]